MDVEELHVAIGVVLVNRLPLIVGALPIALVAFEIKCHRTVSNVIGVANLHLEQQTLVPDLTRRPEHAWRPHESLNLVGGGKLIFKTIVL